LGGGGTGVQVERTRLSHKTIQSHRPSKEQDVLHYQWFADLGNVDAQRAVGHILSHGAVRDLDQALRYFRSLTYRQTDRQTDRQTHRGKQ
jgi:TPR repeat protein